MGCSSGGMSPTSSRNSVPWWANSKRPIFCVIAPVKAPFSWPNSSLSSSPVGIAAQLILTKVRSRRGLRSCSARAIELLARAGLAADEHGGVGGGDGFDLLQHPPQRRALADDLLEVVLRADLFFQVELLLGQLVFQLGDLPIGLRVLHRNGDLLGDLAEQLDLLRAERLLAASAHIQAPSTRSWDRSGTEQKSAHPFVDPVFAHLRFRSQAFQILLAEYGRLAGGDGDTGGCLAV